MEEMMNTAANIEEPVGEQIETSPAVEEQTEETPEVQEAEPVEERTETQRVAQRIKDASQKSVDSFIRNMGLTNPYDGDRPITTKAEYDAFAAMKKLDEAGQTDPVSAYRNQSLEAELAQLRSNERMRELEADPIKGQTFGRLKDQVIELMDYCREQGTPCSVDAAFNTVLANSYFDLAMEAANKAKEDTLRKINNNEQASPGALTGESPETEADYMKMSDKDFEKLYQAALRGELKN